MKTRSEGACERFAENVRTYRRRAGLSQEALGKLADLDRTEVGLIERGKREPRLLTIVKLAAALAVTVEKLCEGIGWQVVAFPETRGAGALLIDGRLAAR
jgi:DNA-binding XRE family transcriptional regulator